MLLHAYSLHETCKLHGDGTDQLGTSHRCAFCCHKPSRFNNPQTVGTSSSIYFSKLIECHYVSWCAGMSNVPLDLTWHSADDSSVVFKAVLF